MRVFGPPLGTDASMGPELVLGPALCKHLGGGNKADLRDLLICRQFEADSALRGGHWAKTGRASGPLKLFLGAFCTMRLSACIVCMV